MNKTWHACGKVVGIIAFLCLAWGVWQDDFFGFFGAAVFAALSTALLNTQWYEVRRGEKVAWQHDGQKFTWISAGKKLYLRREQFGPIFKTGIQILEVRGVDLVTRDGISMTGDVRLRYSHDPEECESVRYVESLLDQGFGFVRSSFEMLAKEELQRIADENDHEEFVLAADRRAIEHRVASYIASRAYVFGIDVERDGVSVRVTPNQNITSSREDMIRSGIDGLAKAARESPLLRVVANEARNTEPISTATLYAAVAHGARPGVNIFETRAAQQRKSGGADAVLPVTPPPDPPRLSPVWRMP
jgi:hypothetical protein